MDCLDNKTPLTGGFLFYKPRVFIGILINYPAIK